MLRAEAEAMFSAGGCLVMWSKKRDSVIEMIWLSDLASYEFLSDILWSNVL